MTTTNRPKARQSQLVTTYGVGALFPAGDQSLMICGLDEWDDDRSPVVEEPRLARSMGVHAFRAPSAGRRSGDVPAVRFPVMHYCPECRLLAPFWKFDAEAMRCTTCMRDLTPSRFVACCEDGHIEDFPYFQWLHRDKASVGSNHVMRLIAKGASSSLADIEIHCSCGVQPHDLAGSFARFALQGVRNCSGSRPWLPNASLQECKKPLRALQRGSANVWFGAIRSAISIPPWSSPDARFVTKHWLVLSAIPDETLPEVVAAMIASGDAAGASEDGILQGVRQRKGLATADVPTDASMRDEEYRALQDGNDNGSGDSFECLSERVDPSLRSLVAQVSRVTRLREVRALSGFTRITAAPTTTTSPATASLSEHPVGWYPAIEVLGEGLFLRLREEAVAQWERTPLAISRTEELKASIAARDGLAVEPPTARYLAVHSLAHALLEELSLEAGYPVGSIRERVYARNGQAGLLLYTASSDAAGSLGGLAALAAPEPLSRALHAALARASWCTNDPVCAESGVSGTDGLNLAACHACLLVPETSCEDRNVFLDRMCLVGSVDAVEAGILGASLTS